MKLLNLYKQINVYYLCIIFNVSTAKIHFFIKICLANEESNIVYNDFRQVVKYSTFSEVR